MSAIFWSTRLLLWRSRGGLIALLMGLALFEFIQPVAIDSFGDLDRLISIMDLVPKPFLALLNVTPEVVEAIGLPGFLALGFTHPVYHLLSAAIVIWIAARGLAGEMERGSIQIALARPVSRAQVYASRLVILVLIGLLIALFSSAGMIVGIALAKPDGSVDYANFIAQAGASFLLAVSIGGVAIAASALADRMGQAVGWASALLIVSYVVDYFAALWDFLSPLQPFSIFNYYDPPAALASGSIPSENLLVLGGVALLGCAIGLAAFTRRDLPN